MDLDDQLKTEHLYFASRTCRVCGKEKDLIDGFYRIRKNKYNSSSYSYECKDCTIIRVTVSRMTSKVLDKWEYPDW